MGHSETSRDIEPSRQPRSSRLTPCPLRLAALLQQVNMVPPDVEMKDLARPFERFSLSGFPEALEHSDVLAFGDMSEERRAAYIKSKIEWYETQIGGVNNALDAFKIISSCLEGLPEAFRRMLWHETIEAFETMRDEIDPTSTDEDAAWDREEYSERAASMRSFVDGCDLAQGASEETIACLRSKLETDEALLADDRYWDVLRDIVEEYTFIREARKKLRQLIVRGNQFRIGGPPDVPAKRAFDWFNWIDIVNPIQTGAIVGIDGDGVVRLKQDRFGGAVEGVDVTRIRECEVCTKIFWAGRKDSYCCSSSCADIRRKRLYRQRGKNAEESPADEQSAGLGDPLSDDLVE